MRSTDDPWPEPVKPLGEKVVAPERKQRTVWTQVPDAPKGVERNKDGRFRNNMPLPGCK